MIRNNPNGVDNVVINAKPANDKNIRVPNLEFANGSIVTNSTQITIALIINSTIIIKYESDASCITDRISDLIVLYSRIPFTAIFNYSPSCCTNNSLDSPNLVSISWNDNPCIPIKYTTGTSITIPNTNKKFLILYHPFHYIWINLDNIHPITTPAKTCSHLIFFICFTSL